MPSYRFAGPYPSFYDGARDEHGRNVGEVEPGDERDFAEAPDRWWVLVEAATETDTADAAAPEDGPAPEEPPAGPVPAPPAIVPNG